MGGMLEAEWRIIMRYVKQFFIIVIISFIGELLNSLIPLPVPASIYGMVILFIALCTGIIKLEHVKEVSDFLIEIMPIMFIPAGAGLINSWGALKPVLFPVTVIMIVTTVIVMVVSGQVTQVILKKGGKKL